MAVGEALDALGAGERPASFDQFTAAIDPQWIADALAATDSASVRRRKLPAEHVVWLVIGMGLFRDRSIAQVVHHLELVLPSATGARRRVTNGAIVQARAQLGAAPLAALFTQTAQAWAVPAANADRWRGLAVYGLDGTTLRVADTPANVAHFGRPPSRHGEGAGYPQLRLVTLLALRTHVLAAAAFAPYRTSEVALATAVWATLPQHAVVILDRGFCRASSRRRTSAGRRPACAISPTTAPARRRTVPRTRRAPRSAGRRPRIATRRRAATASGTTVRPTASRPLSSSVVRRRGRAMPPSSVPGVG